MLTGELAELVIKASLENEERLQDTHFSITEFVFFVLDKWAMSAMMYWTS